MSPQSGDIGGDELDRGGIQHHKPHHGPAGQRFPLGIFPDQGLHGGNPQGGSGVTQTQQVSGQVQAHRLHGFSLGRHSRQQAAGNGGQQPAEQCCDAPLFRNAQQARPGAHHPRHREGEFYCLLASLQHRLREGLHPSGGQRAEKAQQDHSRPNFIQHTLTPLSRLYQSLC